MAETSVAAAHLHRFWIGNGALRLRVVICINIPTLRVDLTLLSLSNPTA